MRKPADADVIKLNIIEMFGKAALSSQSSQTSLGFSKRYDLIYYCCVCCLWIVKGNVCQYQLVQVFR